MDMSPKMTVDRLDQLMRYVFQELVDRGGIARGSDVLEAIAQKHPLSPIELEPNPRSGAARWAINVRFHTTDCVRANWLHKSGDGSWELTAEGRKALDLPPGQMIREAKRKYQDWKRAQGTSHATSVSPEEVLVDVPSEPIARSTNFELARDQAREAIEEHIFSLNPYEFQDLVGHLLHAIGYFVAHTAPRGPDGGVDLLVYKDPLGTVAPRIRVQVKHRRDSKVTSSEIRELQGLIQNDEVGLMVSSGGFAQPAANEARRSSKHVDMIDLGRLITLWQEYYPKLSEAGRAMLPLTAIYHLSPVED